jgi:hypothetical protein
MLLRIIFFYSIILPFIGFSQESKISADEYFIVAKSVIYPAKFAYTTITKIKYPQSSTYTDSGITIIDNNQIYVNTISSTIISGNIGTLNLNHENKIALFNPSDSVMKEIELKFPDMFKDNTDYSVIEPYLEKQQNTLFTKEQEVFIKNDCDVYQKKFTDRIEINIYPKSKTTGYFISSRLVLDNQRRLIETESTYREVYAKSYNGDDKYRIVTQKNTNYKYNSVSSIPAHINDFIEFKNWKIKLKKYTNYKLDVL